MTKGKGGAYLSCASQRSPIAHKGGGWHEPGTRGRGGTRGEAQKWGCARRGEGGVSKLVFASPPLYTPVCTQTRVQKGEGADSGQKREVVFTAYALFTCCFALFLFI